MKVRVFVTDLLDANCYLISHQDQAIIVDPAGIGEEILEVLKEEQLKLIAVINTHGHVDHIAGNAWLKDKTGAPILIHRDDAEYLTNPDLNLSPFVSNDIIGPPADQVLDDQTVIHVGGEELKVIHTPGHTPGGICLLGPSFLISGDTLFKHSVGRSDFPGGDSRVLRESILKLKQLPPETIVYPGHGESTTIGDEIKYNMFMR
ncbi:MAG: MBL fold metallo-hydrolase [Firmicutes bacterium]|nr:MBL fold metallo-hydrolase [Bacillota bacterium]